MQCLQEKSTLLWIYLALRADIRIFFIFFTRKPTQILFFFN
jgi:hypothetical protein